LWWSLSAVLVGAALCAVIIGVWREILIVEGLRPEPVRGRGLFFVVAFLIASLAYVIPALAKPGKRTRSEQIMEHAKAQHYGIPRWPRWVFAASIVLSLSLVVFVWSLIFGAHA
jgi:hypothetical protein